MNTISDMCTASSCLLYLHVYYICIYGKEETQIPTGYELYNETPAAGKFGNLKIAKKNFL